MQTRDSTPFPTEQCTDDDCTNNVPDSTGRELCRSCSNFAQVFGAHPSDVSEASVELNRVETFDQTVYWGLKKYVDGELIGELRIHDEQRARRRKREYECIAHSVE